MKNSSLPVQLINQSVISFCLFCAFSILSYTTIAQAPESCECIVDTLGYSDFIQTLNPDEDAAFQFHVSGTFAVAYGVIGDSTPSVVQNLIDNSPEVTTIVMYACPGSENDDANLEASLLIHNGYKMYLPDNGWVASGATDMFLAGTVRVVEVTPEAVGVHSWSDGSNKATDFPVGHYYHQQYIDYYVNIGLTQQQSEDFYYFTINAASASNIYWMTDSEIDQYKIRSCRYANSPSYTFSQNGNTLIADLDGASYQWLDCNDNNASIDGATNVSFTPVQNGNYALEVTENDCQGISDCSSFMITHITDNFALTQKAYPNPAVDHIVIPNASSYQRIQLYNLLGQAQDVVINDDKLMLSSVVPGTYSIRLFDGTNWFNTTVAKE